jgi:glycosyltransferase involved in cell wall biosynthesis
MLVLNDVAFDGRVRSEAAALAGVGWRVLVVGTQRADALLPDMEVVEGFDLRRVRFGRWGAGLWRPWRWLRHGMQAAAILRALWPVKTRVYHAHDLPALILLSILHLSRRQTRLVYDAHELFLFRHPPASRLAEAGRRLTRPLLMGLEGALARRADGVLALGEGRARLLARWYSIPRPLIVRNALDPPRGDDPAPLGLRAVVGEKRIVVHTGDLDNRRRALSELVRAVALLPEDTALVLLGQGAGAESLRALAEQLGIAERLIILPPVPPVQVAAAIRAADAAAILVRSDSWNVRGGLPNKFYEAVAAGVPVVASDLLVLRRVVRRHSLGVLCRADDPQSIAAALREVLTPDAQARYRACVREAQQVFNWQHEAERLRAFYRELLP